MNKVDIIKACTDLGVHKCGAELGPDVICSNLKIKNIHEMYKVNKIHCQKETNKNNLKKNFSFVNRFNENLFYTACNSLKNGNIPINIGGDHSLSIATCLASKKFYDNIGLIWFDAHADYNTFDTTITGNIHGLPFATVTGQNGNLLSEFFNGNYFDPKKCVLIGARSVDFPHENDNLKKAGIKVITTEDIKKYGIEKVFDEAINIVTSGTEGFHLSIDIDVINPNDAPGVSIPEDDGISSYTFLEIIKKFMNYKNLIKAIDVVEYNPNYDIGNETLNIVENALDIILKSYKLSL